MKYAVMTGALVVPIVFALTLQSGSCGKPQGSGSSAPSASPADAGTSANVSSGAAGGRLEKLRESMWGGEHVVLTVKATGAEIEFDCAHGEIKRPIELNSEGRFEAGGTFVTEGGPVSVPVNGNISEKSVPASYRGRVEGEKMFLTVKLTESGNNVGEFTLARGKAGLLRKCY